MECLKKVLNDYVIENKQQETAKDELLSIEDVQNIFNVSKMTIHKWKKKGLIPYYKMNRKLYFKRSEIFASMPIRNESWKYGLNKHLDVIVLVLYVDPISISETFSHY